MQEIFILQSYLKHAHVMGTMGGRTVLYTGMENNADGAIATAPHKWKGSSVY